MTTNNPDPTEIVDPQDTVDPQDPQDPNNEPLEPTEPDPFEERFAKLQNDTQAWLGRKLKEGFDSLGKQLMPQQPQQPIQPQQVTGIDTSDPEPDFDIYPKEWHRWENRRQQREVTQRAQQRELQYFTALDNPAVRHPDDTVHQAVLQEIVHNSQTGNPITDAQLNYKDALISVLNKRMEPGAPENPLKDNQPPRPGYGSTQPGMPQGTQQPARMPKNLSPASQRLIARAGWAAEDVRKKLGQ